MFNSSSIVALAGNTLDGRFLSYNQLKNKK